MKVLVINSGSSSLKFELIETNGEKTIAKGICERIGISNPIFTYKNILTSYKEVEKPMDMPNHSKAIDIVLKTLQDKENGVITDISEAEIN